MMMDIVATMPLLVECLTTTNCNAPTCAKMNFRDIIVLFGKGRMCNPPSTLSDSKGMKIMLPIGLITKWLPNITLDSSGLCV